MSREFDKWLMDLPETVSTSTEIMARFDSVRELIKVSIGTMAPFFLSSQDARAFGFLLVQAHVDAEKAINLHGVAKRPPATPRKRRFDWQLAWTLPWGSLVVMALYAATACFVLWNWF